ncbi:MAG: DUF222 domain-containing protein, partial [Jatrophihabitantaceae bacterium]
MADAVAVVRDGVDALLGLDISRFQPQQVLDALREVERQKRRFAAVDHVLLANVDERGMAGEHCLPSAAALVQQLLRVSSSEANSRVLGARELADRHDLTGAPLPPVLPAIAAAQRIGSISPAHAAVISRFMHELPATVDREYGAALEACLVHHSVGLDPVQVARAAKKLLARLKSDGEEPDDRENQRRREFTLSKNPDGSSRLSGHLTPAGTAVCEAILDSLAAPVPAEDGERDDRAPGQRRHDAMVDAWTRLLNSGTLPDCGGTPVTVAVTIDAGDLYAGTRRFGPRRSRCTDCSDCTGRSGCANCTSRSGCANCTGEQQSSGGYGTTSHGDLIGISELLNLAAEAEIIPVVLNDARGVMAYGRTRRLASPAQRRALAARDRGCSFPGCARPPAWCSAHHVTAWIDGGKTDIDNLTLLCGFHHREFDRRGWR